MVLHQDSCYEVSIQQCQRTVQDQRAQEPLCMKQHHAFFLEDTISPWTLKIHVLGTTDYLFLNLIISSDYKIIMKNLL